MTTILEILAKIWPFLLAAGGLLFGMFRHEQASKTEAQANQKIAEADAKVAKSNEQAVQAGADNAKVKQNEDIDAAAVPDANRVLHDEGWTRD